MGDVLHEREAELAQLGRAVERVVDGRGGVVLVEGSAGIGKTRLLDEASRMAEGRARVLRARGGEQERDIPLLVTRELFAPYVGGTPADELDRVFAGAAALAGPLLGRGTADAATADAGFALVHGLYWLVANLADDEPLVLVVDDVHWVDEATQRWIAYLLPRVAELSVLLVMAVRPRELEPGGALGVGLATVRDLVTVGPGDLSPDATASVIRSLLPAASGDFCAAVHRATSGNPLLTKALTKAVQDRGLDPAAATARRLAEIGTVGLSRIVLPRLHALGDAAIRLARAVAVLGDGCALVDAAEVGGLGREDAAAAYDALVSGEVLRDDGPAFTHPLVRAVVVDDLPPGTRSALHVRAARVLHAHGADPEDVARHLADTDPVREDWVVPVLREAAALATSRGAPEAAVRHLDALLREDLDRPTRCGVLLDAGWQAFRTGDVRGRAWLDAALETADDPLTSVLAWIAVWNWRLVMLDGHSPQSALDGLPDDLAGDLAYGVAASAALDMGFTGAGLRGQRQLRPVGDPPGETTFERMYLCALAMEENLTCGSAERAIALADAAWRDGLLVEESGDFSGVPWVFATLFAAGMVDVALERARIAADGATRRGSTTVEWYLICVAAAQVASGDIAGAEATLLTWLEQFGEPTVPVGRPSFAALLTEIHRQRGRLGEAYDLLARWSLAAGPERGDWHSAFLHQQRGHLHLASRRYDEALADFRLCEQVLSGFGARRCVFPNWRPGASLALAALGRREEARNLAEEQLADARRWGAAPLLGTSLRTLAAVLGGDDGIRLVEEAVHVLSESPARLELLEARLLQGRLLRLGRQPTRAREALEPALDVAERLGARLLAGQVEEELRLAGARPRRRTVTGVQSLTPAELRVATLAAEGRSNPEIAQSLFITRKTVEKHLGSVFAKLHISSRDQLPAVLESA